MKTEDVTMRLVLDIFSDYLEQCDSFEIVETSKMGFISILDASPERNRSLLSIEEVEDVESLVRQLLWLEIADCYYATDHSHEDPWNCPEEVEEYVRMRIQPRLDKLPEEWRDEIDLFFTDPDLE